MFKNIIKLCLIIVSLSSFYLTSALEISGDVTLEEATKDSLKLSWNEVDGALCYSIYYNTKSVDEEDYSSEDLCVGNDHTIENLEAGTQYFMSLSVASQDLSEGGLSKEFSFKTLSDTGSVLDSSESLKLEGVNVVNEKQLKLSFNIDLSSSKFREFRVVDKADSLTELDVESTELSGTKDILINLVNSLDIDTEYNLTVVDLSGVNGENIELGVDGIASFITPAIFTSEEDTMTEESLPLVGNNTESNIELDSAPSESNNSPGGVDISSDELNKNTDMASKNAKDLPSTGPENILLILFALLVSIFVIKSRSKSY